MDAAAVASGLNAGHVLSAAHWLLERVGSGGAAVLAARGGGQHTRTDGGRAAAALFVCRGVRVDVSPLPFVRVRVCVRGRISSLSFSQV